MILHKKKSTASLRQHSLRYKLSNFHHEMVLKHENSLDVGLKFAQLFAAKNQFSLLYSLNESLKTASND